MCDLPSLDNIGEDRYHLLCDSSVVKSICSKCEKGEVDPAVDPYRKNLQGIVDLLEQALGEVDNTEEDEEQESMCRAREVVHLLSRISETYWACSEAKPTREEMRGCIAHGADCVEKATQRMGKRDAVQHALPPPTSRPDFSITPPSAPETFSEDSIDRQLCYLLSLAPRLDLPPVPPQASRALCPVWGTPSGSSSHFPNLHISARVPTRPRSRMPGEDTISKVVLSRSCTPYMTQNDEGSTITNPLPSPLSPPLTGSLTPRVPPSELEKSGAKTYFVGRDNWDCDFCGPECFCIDLDD